MSWLDQFLSAIATVQGAGVALPQRPTINFVNLTVADDPTNNRTTITTTSLTTPTGTGFVHVTSGVVDGAATNVALATQVTGTLPLANLPHGTAAQVLATNAAQTAPVWVAVGGDIGAATASPGTLYVVGISGAGGAGGSITSTCSIAFADGFAPSITQVATSNPTGEDTLIEAQGGATTGGRLILSSGQGGATSGELHLQAAENDAVVIDDLGMLVLAPITLEQSITWSATGAPPSITQGAATSDVAPDDSLLSAQAAFATASTHTSGGTYHVRGGDAKTPGTTGNRGSVRLEYASGVPMVDVAEVGPNRRVVALCQAAGTPGVTATQVPGSGSDGVVFVWNCQGVPGGTPVGGSLLYAQAGALKAIGTSGTTTTIAPAEPHCEHCGRDFVLEWENPAWGSLQVCMHCFAEEMGEKKWIKRAPVRR